MSMSGPAVPSFDKLAGQWQRIREAQERLLREGGNGDFTIKCGDKTWKCWAALLSQRCEFFKVVTGGSFKESGTKVIELNDENDEEVDMLLLYLYTLDNPHFNDKRLHPHPYTAAESALMLGDKYNLTPLREAGHQFVKQDLVWHIRMWSSSTEQAKAEVFHKLENLWKMDYSQVEHLRQSAIEALTSIAMDVIDYSPFHELCATQPNFAIALIRAQAQEIAKPPAVKRGDRKSGR